MKKSSSKPSPIPVESDNTSLSVGDVVALDLTMTPEDARVHDTLCALQAPSGLTRVSEMMAAANLLVRRVDARHHYAGTKE